MDITLLPAVPTYFPLTRAVYELGPGIKPLGTDFGNGALDQKLFQFTREFNIYRENKLQARRERHSKYIQNKNLTPQVAHDIAQFILQKMVDENPQLFTLERADERVRLQCHLTGDVIVAGSTGLVAAETKIKSEVPAENLLDALLLQIPEDIAILEKDSAHDWVSYLNLCSPSHWAAEDKIGLDFSGVHKPIPGIEPVVKVAHNLTDAMIHKGPFVRFVWSFVTDTRLNHHPVAPAGEDPVVWKGRSFNADQDEPFYLRIERQTTHGFPAVNASLFAIAISFIPASKIKANEIWRHNLKGALEGMTPESRQYKGVAGCFGELMSFLS